VIRLALAAVLVAWGVTGVAESRGNASGVSDAAQTSSAAAPRTAVAADDAQPMEEIVVTGEHEGPRLWRVRKPGQGEHTLWILGTVTPLPKKMIWQSDAVEAVVEESQEVVPAWPAFGIGANPFTALRVWMQWHNMQKIPDRMDLQQVLPPATYARFSALKARYAPRDSRLEELRPAFAAERLLDAALDATGLTFHNEVQQTVLKLARKHGIKIHQDKLRVEDPVDVLKDVGKAPVSGEVACLEAVMGRLETDLGPMQARARAWALGDVDELRRLVHPDDRTACIAAVSTSDRVRELIARAQDDWFLSVEDALNRNRSTLAVQSMDRLLGDKGTLATLRKEGYEVEGP
jgi:uncharacterized protein YbaP (TraB family)